MEKDVRIMELGTKLKIRKDYMKTRKDLYLRKAVLIVYDMCAVVVSGYLALLARFDFDILNVPMEYEIVMRHSLPLAIISTIIIFYIAKLYSSLWTYAGMSEMLNIAVAGVLSGLAETIIIALQNISTSTPVPRSFYFFYTIAICMFVGLSRFIYRGLRAFKAQMRAEDKTSRKKVLIIGAGEAGNSLIREIKESQFLTEKVVGIIDDDPIKIGTYLHGVKVIGDRNKITDVVEQYGVEAIYVAIPTASAKAMKEILEICKHTGCELKRLPGVYQLVNGEVSVSNLRDVNVNDLLGREPIQVDLSSIMGYVSGKTIMVTGGGGSIGSELCRQIVKYKPKQLIIVDIYENGAYDVQNELKQKYPDLDLVVLIASIRDSERIDQIFEKYRPDIVYHAAAHKHVPLMEASPNDAVKNNVLGTLKVVQAADKWQVKKFIMISTDKAVNPTNIMGATKRICEMIIQTYNKHSETEFVATRFGNVLGSNGSVIPLFKKQIAEGGPVTVTHPDIIRYFMTIPEAVSLVLQAGAYAKGGEIFVLDMGEPVKIADLAKNLILLSGQKPDEDIEIVYTGLRPGEKLYEELLMAEEGLQETPNKLIHIGEPIEVDEERFLQQLEELKEYVVTEPGDIRGKVQEIVKTYHPVGA